MGWLYIPKPDNVKKFFRGNFTWNSDSASYRVLDDAIVNITEYYAAVEKVDNETGKRDVFAAVCMLNYVKDKHEYHNFGYKDMDETVGPVITNCPERILKLLTPTDYEWAIKWRKSCWETIERRKALSKLLSVGQTVEVEGGLNYGAWGKVSKFRVLSKKPYRFIALDGHLRGRTVKMTRHAMKQLRAAQ